MRCGETRRQHSCGFAGDFHLVENYFHFFQKNPQVPAEAAVNQDKRKTI